MKTMRLHRLLISAIIALPSISLAQTEPTDSLTMLRDTILKPELTAPTLTYNDFSYSYIPRGELLLDNHPARPSELNLPSFSIIPGQASLYSWSGGAIVASGGIANKYGYPFGVHTQYGINGAITYQLSPKVSLTAFGTYYFGQPPAMCGGLPMPPAMIGYYGASKFGGYVDYSGGEHIGVMVGGQAVQQVRTKRYELEPIVTPYIKIGEGKKKVIIGLPVSQVIYGIMKNNLNRRH
ncbi:MAG: hypothetical protein K2F86_03610 [Duncaniella sp.]|nr:hypothetical protein [Duncaniella sp.]